MTVTYSGNFLRLLARWKGSVWKAIWKQLIAFIGLYYILRVIVKYAIPENNKESLQNVLLLFDTFSTRMSLEFLIAPFVMQVVARWWSQVQLLPWPDDAIALMNMFLPGDDDDTKSKRRTVARYIILSFVLAMRRISSKLSSMVPTVPTLVQSGLLTFEEMRILENMPHKDGQWMMPLEWISQMARTRIGSEVHEIPLGTMGSICGELSKLRSNMRQLFAFYWVPLPLIYTQTSTVLVYIYFGFCLIGHQADAISQKAGAVGSFFIDPAVPVFTILRFIICVGWLQVAEDLWSPFGNDEDDVEIDTWLQRHVKYAYTIADSASWKQPDWSQTNCTVDKSLSLFKVQDQKKHCIKKTSAFQKISKLLRRRHRRGSICSSNAHNIVA